MKRVLPTLVVTILSLCTICAATDSGAPKDLSSLPAAAQSTISAALGRDLADYHIRSTKSGLEATNTHGSLTTHFTAAGVQLATGKLHWAMTLRGYGYGDAINLAAKSSPQANQNRVEYRRGALTEWYENGPVGLEQGFTLAQPPAKRNGKPLTIALDLAGNLTASDANHTALSLKDQTGEIILRYTALTARDADGKDLHATLETHGDTLLVRVEDARARYPLVIDPLLQLAELTSSAGYFGDEFGGSIAISGNTIVVGAPNASEFEGAIYVFVKPATGWGNMTQTAKLTVSNAGYGTFLGGSVSVSGGTIVSAGEPPDIGVAYVFVEPAGGWTNMTETARLTDGSTTDAFGYSVAVDGDTVVVGAREASDEKGAVDVFLKPIGGWQTTSSYAAQLTASDGQANDLFGSSVATNGRAIVVGAQNATVGDNQGQGKAYIFVKPTTGWSTTSNFSAALTASNGVTNNFFGQFASINGNTVVIGVPFASNPQTDQGAAYVYVEPAGGWTSMTETAELTASDGVGGQLGVSVSISGKVIVAGANNAISRQGAAYVFVEPASGWASTSRPTARLVASDGMPSDYFGQAVAMSGSSIVVGAPFTEVESYDSGAVYIFGP